MPTTAKKSQRSASTPMPYRTFVLDTSVLLADPGALKRFHEHEVVLPVVVITELEGKRHHPELGFFARASLRMLDDLRITHGRLDEPVPVGEEGGTIRVELNHTDPDSLPSGFRLGDNDTRILAVARNLANEGRVGHARLEGPAAADQGVGGRSRRRGVPRRGDQRLRQRLHRHGRAGRHLRRARRAVRRRVHGPGGRPRAALPHRPGAALRPGYGARPGRPGQAGAPGPRRPRGVRPPRPFRRAADRPGDPARPRGRHRLARWPRRHRQVCSGALRRPRGGHGASSAQEGRGLPAAVRGRRPGARLPARGRSRRRCRPGPRRSSTPSARSPPAT